MSTSRLHQESRLPWWLRIWRRSTPRRRPNERNCRPILEHLEERCTPTGGFLQTNLVADTPGLAAFTDPNLINPWGLASNPAGSFWTSDNRTGLSTLYDGNGQPQVPSFPTAVTIPLPAGSPAGTVAAPTGIVFNGGPGFVVSEDGRSGSSLFLFATEDGTIAGWNATVDADHAILAVDHSSTLPGSGAVYKGLALGTNASGTFLYATDFRGGAVAVFDDHFHEVRLSGSFSDPALPAGFAPFGIQNIGNKLFVTYAKQDANKYEDVRGPGNGFIDVFDTDGHLLQRLTSGGELDSPWGMALAPSSFGAFGNDLLVGNVGDGRIDAFNPTSGAYLGSLQDSSGEPVMIAGLWGLQFGTGGAAHALFFTAGPGEDHGLFGKLEDVSGRGFDFGIVSQPSDSSGDATPQDSYPLPPATGPALRPDAGIQVRPPLLPAALPLRDFGAASPQLPLTYTQANSESSVRASQAVLSAANEVDNKPATAVPSRVVTTTALPDGAGDRLTQEYSAALAVVLEVSARWDAVEISTGTSVDTSATVVNGDPVSSDVVGSNGQAREVATVYVGAQPSEVGETRRTGITPPADQQKVEGVSLGWAQPLAIFVLAYAIVRTWYHHPTSSRTAAGPPNE